MTHTANPPQRAVEPPPDRSVPRLALVLTGGGARAAYQVGLLRWLGRRVPELRFDIITGVSAGAINACYLASHAGDLAFAATGLTDVWAGLEPERVFRVDTRSLLSRTAGWGLRLVSGGAPIAPKPQSLVDASPLSTLLRDTLEADEGGQLTGITRNIAAGRLRAIALTTLDWATGVNVTWVQDHDVAAWSRPGRESRLATLTLDHVLASASLPMIFPAVRLDGSWHGDGGVRLTFPLAPALHLGADRILAISTRHAPQGGRRSADTDGYPPPAQIAGVLFNAVFLDALDSDAHTLQRLNRLLPTATAETRRALRPIELCVIRPSTDLGRLAAKFEWRLPGAFRFMTRGLGTKQTRSPDLLSLLLFQRDYVEALMEIGEQDAEVHGEELLAIVAGRPATPTSDADARSRESPSADAHSR
ncbi:MAG TPA: patatin-like phospholipase family protein [Thermoanaerobaculia bacterium]|nr:patatin-like phospholipase family protein [Thermoanaerobaculia bacterium]